MSDVAIRVENLSKRYRIGTRQAGYATIRETVTDLAAAPVRRLRRLGQPTPPEETIWALKDVSFEVKPGEVVGIIGRNGAGKTTLLRVLCRITEPTEGQAEIHGRVGSLLEVGTGFHPELTGRENIYLNGAILGMKRTEIDSRFDEIVQFAEIDKFLDTPVKRYSSGMYVRLAFAVAAHLEPEILVVDEVLSVGDAAFQKKCLGKMEDVSKKGRTVLFVSHNMAAVQSLCDSGIVLDSGSIQYSSGAAEAIAEYLKSLEGLSESSLLERANGARNEVGHFTSVWFENSQGDPVTRAMSGQPANLCLGYETQLVNPRLTFAVGFYSSLGQPLAYCSTAYSARKELSTMPPKGIMVCSFPRLPLLPGRYIINIALHCDGNRIDHVPAAATLDVQAGDFYGTGKIPMGSSAPILLDHDWRLL